MNIKKLLKSPWGVVIECTVLSIALYLIGGMSLTAVLLMAGVFLSAYATVLTGVMTPGKLGAGLVIGAGAQAMLDHLALQNPEMVMSGMPGLIMQHGWTAITVLSGLAIASAMMALFIGNPMDSDTRARFAKALLNCLALREKVQSDLADGKVVAIVGDAGTGKTSLAKRALPDARIKSADENPADANTYTTLSNLILDDADLFHPDDVAKVVEGHHAEAYRVIVTARSWEKLAPMLAGIEPEQLRVYDLNLIWGTPPMVKQNVPDELLANV